MRRILIVLLSVVLVLGLSFTADARHQTEETEYNPGMVTAEGVQIMMSGSIRARGEYKKNVQLDVDSDGNNDSKYDTRVRLKIDARVTPGTMGVLELESGDFDSDTYTWGALAGATGIYQVSDYKPTDMHIRQAYIAHQGSGLLGRTAGFKIGHMLFALGNGIFYDHSKFGDDGAIFWTGLGDGEISFNYLKLDEFRTGQNDDANAYALALEMPVGNINVSADVTYVDDQDLADDRTVEMDLWNFGLRGDMNIAGLDVRGDIEFQTGEIQEDGMDDLDIGGYAFLVGADYAIGDISVGAEVAYGSGDDDPDDNDLDLFVTSLGSSQHYTYVYEYRAMSAAGGLSTGLSNTWYVNVGGSASPTPDLTTMLDLYYLQAAEDVSLKGGDEDDDLGWEVDAKVEYQIDKNLLYYIEGGYFWPGDAYKNHDGDDADDAYAVRNGVILKF